MQTTTCPNCSDYLCATCDKAHCQKLMAILPISLVTFGSMFASLALLTR